MGSSTGGVRSIGLPLFSWIGAKLTGISGNPLGPNAQPLHDIQSTTTPSKITRSASLASHAQSFLSTARLSITNVKLGVQHIWASLQRQFKSFATLGSSSSSHNSYRTAHEELSSPGSNDNNEQSLSEIARNSLKSNSVTTPGKQARCAARYLKRIKAIQEIQNILSILKSKLLLPEAQIELVLTIIKTLVHTYNEIIRELSDSKEQDREDVLTKQIIAKNSKSDICSQELKLINEQNRKEDLAKQVALKGCISATCLQALELISPKNENLLSQDQKYSSSFKYCTHQDLMDLADYLKSSDPSGILENLVRAVALKYSNTGLVYLNLNSEQKEQSSLRNLKYELHKSNYRLQKACAPLESAKNKLLNAGLALVYHEELSVIFTQAIKVYHSALVEMDKPEARAEISQALKELEKNLFLGLQTSCTTRKDYSEVILNSEVEDLINKMLCREFVTDFIDVLVAALRLRSDEHTSRLSPAIERLLSQEFPIEFEAAYQEALRSRSAEPKLPLSLRVEHDIHQNFPLDFTILYEAARYLHLHHPNLQLGPKIRYLLAHDANAEPVTFFEPMADLLRSLRASVSRHISASINQFLEKFSKEWDFLSLSFDIQINNASGNLAHTQHLNTILNFCKDMHSELKALQETIVNTGDSLLNDLCNENLEKIAGHLTELTSFIDRARSVLSPYNFTSSPTTANKAYYENMLSGISHLEKSIENNPNFITDNDSNKNLEVARFLTELALFAVRPRAVVPSHHSTSSPINATNDYLKNSQIATAASPNHTESVSVVEAESGLLLNTDRETSLTLKRLSLHLDAIVNRELPADLDQLISTQYRARQKTQNLLGTITKDSRSQNFNDYRTALKKINEYKQQIVLFKNSFDINNPLSENSELLNKFEKELVKEVAQAIDTSEKHRNFTYLIRFATSLISVHTEGKNIFLAMQSTRVEQLLKEIQILLKKYAYEIIEDVNVGHETKWNNFYAFSKTIDKENPDYSKFLADIQKNYEANQKTFLELTERLNFFHSEETDSVIEATVAALFTSSDDYSNASASLHSPSRETSFDPEKVKLFAEVLPKLERVQNKFKNLIKTVEVTLSTLG